VGRANELAALRLALGETLAGSSAIVLVQGEPGIGKTRLLHRLGGLAREYDACICWGRAWEGEGAPGYWPWIQVLRALADEEDLVALASSLGSAAGDLAGFLPELTERLGVVPPPTATEPEQARFRIFDSFARALRFAARKRPLVLLLDDLHCADGDSVRLFEFIVTHLVDCRLLMVAALRPAHVGQDAKLGSAFAVVVRKANVRRLELGGLSEAEVAVLMQKVVGHPLAHRLVAAVHRRTNGNPLFVSTLLPFVQRCDPTDPDAELAAMAVPHTIQQVIGLHLDQLPQASRSVLEMAAVAGREFDLLLLERALGLSTEELLAALEPPRRRGTIVADRQVPGRHRFTHALLRDVIYDALPAASRLERHRCLAGALETYGNETAQHLATTAHHYLHALPLVDLERTVALAEQAARGALEIHSYDTAAALLRGALHALEAGGAPIERRSEILLALGGVQRIGGYLPDARDTFTRAAELARELGAPELLARAALGVAEPWTNFGYVDDLRTRLLEDALLALGPEPSPLRLRVLARLAPALHGTRSYERMLAMLDESIDGARRLGDEVTLLFALDAAHLTMRGPAYVEERRAYVREIRSIATRRGDQEMCVRVHLMALPDALESRHLATAVQELEAAARLATELRQPRYQWQVMVSRAALAAHRGRYEEAERLAGEAWSVGQRAHVSLADLYYLGLLGSIRRIQGRFAELAEPSEREFAKHPVLPIFRVYDAAIRLALGQADEARSIFEREVDGALATLPQDLYWAYTLALFAELCHQLDDLQRAERLYELLAPYAGHAVVLGTLAVSEGSIAYRLGLLACTLGRETLAEAHFRQAILSDRALEAWPALVLSELAYGRMLLARGAARDSELARMLLDRAERNASELRLDGVARAARIARDATWQLAPPVDAHAVAPARREPVPADRSEFRLEGHYWTIAFRGTVIRLKSTKGLEYIAALLACSGRELHVLDLAQARIVGGNGCDGTESVDRRAREAYRARLEELRWELTEAERHNDLARVEALRGEMSGLAGELAATHGLLGRPRRTATPSERARVTVRNDITRALNAIRKHHLELWRHLYSSLHTGTFCSYKPERSIDWLL
jgi:tetratricopeptide (TPR) repeat protein